MSTFLAIVFALLGLHQAFETARAIRTKRVRRLTYRPKFVTLEEDRTVYWFDTGYHAFAVVILGMMSFWMINGGSAS